MANPAVARETFFALRHAIARIEGRLVERLETPGSDVADLPPALAARMRQPMLQTGVEAFDVALGGGLPLAGLVELHGQAVRDGAATAGFALGLSQLVANRAQRSSGPLLWIATTEMFRESGRPYAPGLAARFGIAPDDLIMAEAARLKDVLWIAEEAANAGVFRTVLVEVRGSSAVLDLTATRRLHRRALLAGHPLFLLRHAGHAQPTAAPLRLQVAPGRSEPRATLDGPLAGSIGPPVFRITVDKSRAALTSAFTLEWTHDSFRDTTTTTYSGAVVPAPPRRAGVAPAARTVVAFPRRGGQPGACFQPAGEQYPARRGA